MSKEAKEVIEGLMKGLSRFRRFIFVNSTLADLYNHAIPALEKAQDYLDGLDGQDCPVESGSKFSEMDQEELEDAKIHVMSISYYLVDEDGNQVLNDDGTVKTWRSEGEDLPFVDCLDYECLIEE